VNNEKRRSLVMSATAAIFGLTALLACALVMAGEPQNTSAKAFFLVASRNMPDPVFQQSVILMLPGDEPPLVAGVIINKPTDVTLSNLFKQPLAPENRNQKVYFGGPVELTTPLLLIRTSRPPKQAIKLRDNVYGIADASTIAADLQDPHYANDTRLSLGRAQWAQEQLRGELLEGAWTVVPLRTDLLFDRDAAKVWPILSQHEHVREINARCPDSNRSLALTACADPITW